MMEETPNTAWSPKIASQRTTSVPVPPGAMPPQYSQQPLANAGQQASPVYNEQQLVQQPGQQAPQTAAAGFDAFQNYALHVPFMSRAVH
ncbi:hypothetical protein EC988_005254 [Linderina pennispora]|nr:hypothetical protein EC988_005254 [Linderina pennispora]